MDIQTRKIAFEHEFLKIQNEEVIIRLEKILQKENENFKQMGIEEFNQRMDKSMEDSKNGRLTKASDLKAKVQKWY